MDYLRLNRPDEYFLDSDTVTAPTHIGGLEIYRLPEGAGKDFIQTLYAYLRKAPARAEPFNYKLETIVPEPARGRSLLGRLRPGALRGRKPRSFRAWAKLDKVNVDEHIYLHALPRPGGQRELGELVARLHVNRLDRNRPLWEVHLIEGLEGGRFAVYTKLHHSQFDGKRGVALMQYTRSTDPAERGLPPVWAVDLKAARVRAAKGPTKKTHAPSTLQTLASWGTALQKVGELSVGKPEGGKIAPYSAPASILNGALTARRRLGTVSLSTERMKAIGAAVPGGATVNEILLAVCGGALRAYLKDQRALPKRPLIAACPVARVRTDDSASGNAVGQILVSLGTDIADPRRRLLAVVASSRANKDLMNELDSDTYQNYTQLSMVPQILAAKTGVRAQGTQCQSRDLERARSTRDAVRQWRESGGDVCDLAAAGGPGVEHHGEQFRRQPGHGHPGLPRPVPEPAEHRGLRRRGSRHPRAGHGTRAAARRGPAQAGEAARARGPAARQGGVPRETRVTGMPRASRWTVGWRATDA
ncbi:MAG: wax ester/triacylglycerol synthase domain-containing protein [Steroidobacteraceae bacterium]